MRAWLPRTWPKFADYFFGAAAGLFFSAFGFFFFLSSRWLLLPFPMAGSPYEWVDEESVDVFYSKFERDCDGLLNAGSSWRSYRFAASLG